MSVLSLAQDDDAPGIGYRRVLCFPCDKEPISEENISSNYYVIPTCTICAERLEPTLTGYTFRTCRCPPDRECTCFIENSSCVVCQTAIKMQRGVPEIYCDECQLSGDPWICLVCGFVGCSRYQAQHARQHFLQQRHFFSMSLLTQQIWDYESDAFVHRIVMTFDVDTGTVQRVQYPDRDNPPTTLEDDDAGDVVAEKAKKKHINAKYDSELETSNEKLALMIKEQLDLHRAECEGLGSLQQQQQQQREQREGANPQMNEASCHEFAEYNAMNVNRYHVANRRRWLSLFLENQRLTEELRMQVKEEAALKESQDKLEGELRDTVRQSATEDIRLTGEILNLQETIKDIELNISVQRQIAEKLEGDEYECLRVVGGVEGKADPKARGRMKNKSTRRRS
ncbi:BRCA1-associated protein [Trypanosoma conorhini]|uniref:BRCA1-associated protein n=1 Tax=Trypanosoma conorhini TaxID=83891 RepID=A0A3R7PGC9_9TRYP|nr:BRCA1-associated protein [Trypanosoma conorhini]RNF19439.1 BRCA1-associated protein [Trypanosoma conorhini]